LNEGRHLFLCSINVEVGPREWLSLG